MAALWRKCETCSLLTGTAGRRSTGHTRASSDYDPRVKDDTSGALSKGAFVGGLGQDEHLKP